MTFTLRPYQEEDVASTLALWDQGTRSVIGVAATGLGKGIVIAEIVRRRIEEGGRALVLVDMGTLADQLFRTLAAHTGITPDVEIADMSASQSLLSRSPIVLSTFQTQWSGVHPNSRAFGWSMCHSMTLR